MGERREAVVGLCRVAIALIVENLDVIVAADDAPGHAGLAKIFGEALGVGGEGRNIVTKFHGFEMCKVLDAQGRHADVEVVQPHRFADRGGEGVEHSDDGHQGDSTHDPGPDGCKVGHAPRIDRRARCLDSGYDRLVIFPQGLSAARCIPDREPAGVRWCRGCGLSRFSDVARALACFLLVFMTSIARGQGVELGRVRLEVQEFGVGNTVRPGGWVGLRVRVFDPTTTPRELLIRVAGRDADGDLPYYQQVIAAGDGASRDIWTYVPIPYHFDANSTVEVIAATVVGSEGSDEPPRAGDVLARTLVSPAVLGEGRAAATTLHPEEGLIGVIGRGNLSLTTYAERIEQQPWSPLAHERTEIVLQLNPQSLPDRWIGLAPFDALVWTDAEPADLGIERARAITEWVRRGGHLVVVLPPVGQAWTTPRSNPLHELLPRVDVIRSVDAVDLNPLAPLLAGTGVTGLPAVTVHTFEPRPEAEPHQAIAVLGDPRGRTIVARRIEGLGMVTLVGVDLNNAGLRRLGLPRADRFWNRVLGKRGEYLTTSELADASVAPRWNLANRRPHWLDQDIPGLIAKQGRSAAGLFAGFFLFALYWLVAGPVGYGLLKRFGYQRHAWVAYVVSAAGFTVLAWSSALAIRPKRVEATHLTIIDHVYLQPVQRTRTWMSMLVPTYGQGMLHVGDPRRSRDDDYHNLIAPWQSRRLDARSGGFPDVRPYVLDARAPESVSFPARATIKQFRVDWSGPPVDDWGMPRPRLPDGQQGEPALWLDARTGDPRGLLTHGLPGPMSDVVIIVARHQRAVPTSPRASVALAAAYKLTGDWHPGHYLDLSTLGEPATLDAYLDRIMPPPRTMSFGAMSEDLPGDPTTRLSALAFFDSLPTPAQTATAGTEFALMRRSEGHGLDLSRWLTQPCIIIIGHVGLNTPEAAPTPLWTGEASSPRRLRTTGRTVVRWVYPLPARVPEWTNLTDVQADPLGLPPSAPPGR